MGGAAQGISSAEVNRQLTMLGESPIQEIRRESRQEKNTALPGDGDDIADIILDGRRTTIVVENSTHRMVTGTRMRATEVSGLVRPTAASWCFCAKPKRGLPLWTDGRGRQLSYSRRARSLAPARGAASRLPQDHVEQYHFIENMHRHFTNRMGLRTNRDSLVDSWMRCAGAGRPTSSA